MSLGSVTVFQFQDYREFLRRVTHTARVRGRRPTLQRWARGLGYRSPRTFAMVLKGQRTPSPSMVERLARLLELTKEEKLYFELLVRLGREREQGVDTRETERELERLHPRFPDEAPLDRERFANVAEWYHFPVRQLVGTPSFREDAGWIRERLREKITEREARCALDTLTRLGLLQRDETGRLRVVERPVRSTRDLPDGAIQSHHRQMLERAREAVAEQPIHRREMSALTLRLDPRRLGEAKTAIRIFKDRFHKEFEAPGSEAVMQLNVALFEHTRTAIYPRRKK